MLKLINVKKEGNIIEANYIPEFSNEIGFLKVDLGTEEIIENTDTSADKYYQTYLLQARYALIAISDQKEYKKEYTHMWY